MDGLTETPNANRIFHVREDGAKLSRQHQDLFQTLVSKILFVGCQWQPNPKTAIDLLITRVKHTNLDGYKNLARCGRYIRATVEIPLILEANKSIRMSWWVYAAYGVHLDIKIHSRGMIKLGKGAIQIKLSKKISTPGVQRKPI